MPSSAAQAAGGCCVCGEKTSNQCSACGAAGFNLFFCRKEHQKLAWFAHKPYCGRRSNAPFRFPPLSEEEVKEAKELAVVPMPQNGRTIVSQLCSWLSIVREKTTVFAMLDRLATPEPGLSARDEAGALCCIRAALLNLAGEAAHRRNRIDLRISHPLWVLATMGTAHASARQDDQGREIAPPYPTSDEVYTRFMHHALVTCALAYRMRKDVIEEFQDGAPTVIDREEAKRWILCSYAQLQRVLGEMRRADPRTARVLAEQLTKTGWAEGT